MILNAGVDDDSATVSSHSFGESLDRARVSRLVEFRSRFKEVRSPPPFYAVTGSRNLHSPLSPAGHSRQPCDEGVFHVSDLVDLTVGFYYSRNCDLICATFPTESMFAVLAGRTRPQLVRSSSGRPRRASVPVLASGG